MKKLVVSCLLTLTLMGASCKSRVAPETQNGAGGDASGQLKATSSTPPFATKEPDRYQATRIITTGGAAATADGTPVGQTFIARDGDRRREDYESAAGEKISYLQLPGGNYVLLPARKVYAELKSGADGPVENGTTGLPPEFSPDKLLNEARPESQYERLGADTVNGRATVKYRVSMSGKTGASREVTTESLVWVDDTLGMPIKSETTSKGGLASGETVTMVLRDIKETVDAGLFDLPSDYRKLEIKELFAQVPGEFPR